MHDDQKCKNTGHKASDRTETQSTHVARDYGGNIVLPTLQFSQFI